MSVPELRSLSVLRQLCKSVMQKLLRAIDENPTILMIHSLTKIILEVTCLRSVKMCALFCAVTVWSGLVKFDRY